MALREPLNNMLWEETRVHTGLSWARIVLTFCRVWMSHTYMACTQDKGLLDDASLQSRDVGLMVWMNHAYDDGAISRSAVQFVPVETKNLVTLLSVATEKNMCVF